MNLKYRASALLLGVSLLASSGAAVHAQDSNDLEVEVSADPSAALTVYFSDGASSAVQTSANYQFDEAIITGLSGATVTGDAFLYVLDNRLDDNTGFALSVLINDADFTGGTTSETFPANTASIVDAATITVLDGDTPTAGANATTGALTTSRVVLEAADGTNTEAVQTLGLEIDVPAGTSADTYTATLEVTVVGDVTP